VRVKSRRQTVWIVEDAAARATERRRRQTRPPSDAIAPAELNKLDLEGTVVIGEGDEPTRRDAVQSGEKVGMHAARRSDYQHAIRLRAHAWRQENMPGASATMAMADMASTVLHAPAVYVPKIAFRPGLYTKGVVELDAVAADNVPLAKAKAVRCVRDTVLVLRSPAPTHMSPGS